MNLFLLTNYLRLAPFDTSTEQGRSDERYRLVFLTMVANVFNRGTSVLVMVLTVSLTIKYLGAERFGVWMTIASFVGMLTFLDLGVGNALTSKVAQVAAENHPIALRQTISGGLGFLFVLGCIVGGFLYTLVDFLPWDRLIKVQDLVLRNEIRHTVAVFSILFGLNLFTNGLQRIFAGLQRAFEAHLVSVAGSFFSIFALWILTGQAAGIPYLLAATLGIQSITNLWLLLLLVKRNLFALNRIASDIRIETKQLLHVGGLFFVIQIATMVLWGADSLIISSSLGAAQVASFSIAQRLFQFITQPLNIFNDPLWAAYADANSRGEKAFIRKTLRSSLIGTSGICLVGAAVLLLVGQRVAGIWTGNAVNISLALLAAYGSWAVLDAVGHALAMFLNGCGIVKPQVVTVITLIIIMIPVKIFLIAKLGLAAMFTGQALCYLLIVSISYGVIYRKTLMEKWT